MVLKRLRKWRDNLISKLPWKQSDKDETDSRKCSEIKVRYVNKKPPSIIQSDQSKRCLQFDNLSLKITNLQRDDPSFLFEYDEIFGYRDNGKGDHISLCDFRPVTNLPYYITIGSDKIPTIKKYPKSKKPLTKISTCDGRYFEFEIDGNNYHTFKSLLYPGYYLAYNSKTKNIYLKEKEHDSFDEETLFKILPG